MKVYGLGVAVVLAVAVALSPAVASGQTPVGQTGTWNLKFADEFNGTALDLNTWEPSWFGGNGISEPVNTEEDGCYAPSQVTVGGGSLHLTAASTSDPNCDKRGGSPASYKSGLINSREHFTYAYGYMEARMFLPGSGGDIYNWPAFWSDGTGQWPITGEIDVMEGLSGHQPCWHYHYQAGGQHQGPGGCANMDGTGWHVYAAKWEPGKITWYYDGNEVGVWTTGVVGAQHFLILNHGLKDEYGIHVPATVDVDYVRVWDLQAGPPPGQVVKRVGAGADDAEEQNSTGQVDLASSDLELVNEPFLGAQTVAMRFSGLAIPPGATVTSANVRFTVDETGSAPAGLTFRAHATDNSTAFTTATGNVSSRPKTSASAAWSPPAWASAGQSGADQTTPDLAALIQEVVSRPGWASGNALSLIATGSGVRVASSFESGSALAPLLTVNYTTGSPPPDTTPPTAPSNLTAQVVSSSRIDLSWGASTDNVGVTGYSVERCLGAPCTNFAEIATPSGSPFPNSGLAAGTAYRYRVRARDAAGNLSPYSNSVTATTSNPTATHFTKRVAASADDAEEQVSSGAVDLVSSDLELVNEQFLGTQVVGLRFTGVTIPRNAQIQAGAYVQFAADEVTFGSCSLTIRGQAADNAATFTTSNKNVTNRATTTASTAWSPPAWPTAGAAGAAQRTADLSSVIQQIVNRPGWVSGNSLVLVFSGSCTRIAKAWNGEAGVAPQLVVDYV